MQQRHLVWLLGTLVILLGVAYLSGAFTRDVSTVEVPNFAIPADQIDEIELTMTDASITRIVRQNNAWRMVEPVDDAADTLTISRFTEGLENMELESVVSTNPERYEGYGVGGMAKKVKITWDGNSESFFVGNAGPDLQSLYIRLEDDPRVFLCQGRLTVPDHSDPWRDRTLINIAKADIDRVVVSGPELDYEVAKAGNSWEIVEDDQTTAADSASVARWLNRFAPFKGLGFVDTPDVATLKAEATHQIHFNSTGGSTQTLWFKEAETNSAVTVSGSAFVARIATSSLANLMPDPESLE